MSDGMKKKKRPRRPRMDNEEAIIAIIMYFFIAVGVFAFFLMVLGSTMESFTDVHNNLSQSGALKVSQDRQDALGVVQGAFNSLPIILFILSIITALMMALSSRDRVV